MTCASTTWCCAPAGCVLPDGERPAAVRVRDGRIAAIEAVRRTPGQDLGDLALLPGLVDTHVHVNEPGRTEWEGFATATRAAAAGGVTTIIDMPLNCIPPTVDVAALAAKRRPPRGQCHVDVGFWGGAVPGNAAALPPLHDAGVFGFKCFLVDSGVPEFPPLVLGRARPRHCRAVDALFVVHAEDPADVRAARSRRRATPTSSPPGRRRPRPARSPPSLDAARRTGARVHILHLSAADALPLIAAGPSRRRPGDRRDLPALPDADGRGDAGRRDRSSSAARRSATRPTATRSGAAWPPGVIDCVVSDHSPVHRPSSSGWTPATSPAPGAASPRCSSGCRWSGPRARARGHTLADVVDWMARRPADLVGLRAQGPHRGRAPTRTSSPSTPRTAFMVDPAALHHRHPVTPYAGQHLHGVVAHDLAARRARSTAITRAARCLLPGGCAMTDFTALPDLASRPLGGGVVACNDEFFAAADNLVEPAAPGFTPEDLRRQGPGLRRLGDPPAARTRATTGRSCGSACPGVVRGVVVDTAWFTGNYPPYAVGRGTLRRRLPVAGRAGRRDLGRAAADARRSPATPPTRSRWRAEQRCHPRTAVDLSRRRRGAAAGARRGRARPALLRTRPLARPGRDGARRPGGRLQQHVLRLARTTCCCPVWPAPWARAGRPRGAATTATTGCWSGSACPAWCASPSSTRATSRATRPVARRASAPRSGTGDPRPSSAHSAIESGDCVVRSAAAHPAAARHPAPLPRRRRCRATHVRMDVYPDGGMARLRLLGVPS